ncbi:MAG: DUF721 domain-containing protein [Saprospiraceae bacterium]|nr:DUF721 domain-containing protein [Saprospiraceae bacterium]
MSRCQRQGSERILYLAYRRNLETRNGSIISGYTSKLYFKDGLLKIYLTSAPLKKELSMSKPKIIENLNAALGTNLIKEVEVY